MRTLAIIAISAIVGGILSLPAIAIIVPAINPLLNILGG